MAAKKKPAKAKAKPKKKAIPATTRQKNALAKARKDAAKIKDAKDRKKVLRQKTAAIKKKYAPAIRRQQKAAQKKRDAATTAALTSQFKQIARIAGNNPEVNKILRDAAKRHLSTDRFQALFQGSKWYQEHSAAWRNAETQRLGDPASYNQAIEKYKDQIRAEARAMGAQLSESQVATMAKDSVYGGWEKDTLVRKLAAHVKFGEGQSTLSGQAGEWQQQLRELADANGVAYSNEFYQQAVQSTFESEMTLDDFEDQIRQDAAGTYKAWADKILAGNNVKDLASPYLGSMSRILEIPETEMSLADPSIREAITATTDDGSPAVKQLADFEKDLRKDPRWMKTTNGQNTVAQAGMNLAKAWGLVS